jgi:hypothetical protein
MYNTLMSHAQRIAKGDEDLAQSIVSLAYQAYSNANEKGKVLSVGELVNVMKYRAGDIRSGVRQHYGSIRCKFKDDVYNMGNYLRGDLELLSINFNSEDDDEDRGRMAAKTAHGDFSNVQVFKIGLQQFLKRFDEKVKEMFNLRRIGFTYKEIAAKLKTSAQKVREQLKELGRQFILYFQLPESYLLRFGLT